MKKLIVIVSMAALLSGTAPAQTWTGASSTQWDLANNWSGNTLPSGGTAQAAVEGWGAGYTNAQPAFGWPVIDSSINTYWGLSRFRGPGLHFTQTGGTNEWSNGSGRSSKGITLQSRPPSYPNSVGSPNDPAHPCLMKITGGTHITDAIGLGVPGGLNSGTLQSDPPNGGGDFAEDTANYRVWQTTPGDDRYGWGRLQIQGDATVIVRPNRFVWPIGYTETNAYWVYESTNTPVADWYCRVFDIAIGTNSQMILSDNAKLVAPYKIFTNNIMLGTHANDPDLLTQLKYYAGLVQAGASPHYVSNGALSGARLVAGPGQTLQFDLFPAGTNDVNEPYGGYFTVTAVPAPFVQLNLLSASSLAIGGLVGREYQIESTDDLNSGWSARTNFTLAASPATWNDPTPSSTNRFYRAAMLPLP